MKKNLVSTEPITATYDERFSPHCDRKEIDEKAAIDDLDYGDYSAEKDITPNISCASPNPPSAPNSIPKKRSKKRQLDVIVMA
ncbi:hypothetical protein [Photobacterium kasasachensis]|uniref:hypothetical protein n=1 Tax=Photobacterium kasasachensis TaxID=2910240 RepID=UPI003D1415B7